MHSIFQEKNHVPCCHIQSFFVRLLSPCGGGFCNVKNARELQNRMVKLLHREYSIEYSLFILSSALPTHNPHPPQPTPSEIFYFILLFIIYYLLLLSLMGPIHSKCDFLGNDASHFFILWDTIIFISYLNLKHEMTN